jgi:D-alanyl-D-alanine carboxypeptidase
MTFKQEVQLLTVLILFLVLSFMNTEQNKKDVEYITKYRLDRDTKKMQKIIDNTTAEGVIVYDASTQQVLGSKNIDKTYSLASLTKIITATIVYEKDKTLLNEIREMLKTSNNEEADRLAFHFGSDKESQVVYMNAFTKRFGGFYFRNTSGLDIKLEDTGLRYAGGEAKPVALISFIREYYFKYPELFDQTLIADGNTNMIVNQLSFLNGGKTGYTDLSGGNLFVSVQKGLDRQIFIIVLNSTEKNRFVDVQHIAHFLLQSSI